VELEPGLVREESIKVEVQAICPTESDREVPNNRHSSSNHLRRLYPRRTNHNPPRRHGILGPVNNRVSHRATKVEKKDSVNEAQSAIIPTPTPLPKLVCPMEVDLVLDLRHPTCQTHRHLHLHQSPVRMPAQQIQRLFSRWQKKQTKWKDGLSEA
jgi:hypothetical protein